MSSADHLFFIAALLAALGCGLIAGVFFAFSTFVMKALERVAPSCGMAAMQSINVVVLNPVFLGAFVGTALVCLGAVALAFMHWERSGAIFLLAGGLLYLVGTFFVTMAFNVPRNEALRAVDAKDPRAASLWAAYVPSWTLWNHVRTAAAFAATVAFTLALAAKGG